MHACLAWARLSHIHYIDVYSTKSKVRMKLGDARSWSWSRSENENSSVVI